MDDGLLSMESQRVRHNLATKQQQNSNHKKRKNYKIDAKSHESFGYTSDSSVTLGKLFDLSDPQFPL